MSTTAPMDAYAPFSTGTGADATELMWRKFMHPLRDDGVIATAVYPPEDPSELRVSADGSGMVVAVEPGEAWLHGHWGAVHTTKQLSIIAADPTSPRIDLVVARADFVTNVVELDVLTGTPAGTPVAPTPTEDLDTAWEIPLAEVRVNAGVVSISGSNVTDARRRVGLGLFNHYDPPLYWEGAYATLGDNLVNLGTGATKTCRWYLMGKVLFIRYHFLWGTDPYNGGTGRIYTRLPAGLAAANQGYNRLWTHLWTSRTSATPVNQDWVGTSLVAPQSELVLPGGSRVFPFFMASATDTRVSWYVINDHETPGPGSGVPAIPNSFPEGGGLAISGFLEVY